MSHHPLLRRAQGFSIPELLVAITVGLVILAGMSTLFVNNSRAQARVERANRQIENGRFVVDAIATDLRNAGYYGEYDPTELPTPAAPPDPCALTVGALQAALPLHVQGYDATSPPSCLADVRSGTDILVVRHARNCLTGDPNCDTDGIAGPLFQASLCDNTSELGSGNAADHYALDTNTANLTRHQRDCTLTAGTGTLAPTRRFMTHIYFVANNDNPGDGVPTLKRAELRIVNGALNMVVVPLAEGVTTLQLEYGLDTDDDGVVDQTTTAPGAANACAAPACAAANWRNVLSVRMAVLATNGDTGANLKTQTFQSLILMPNPAGRKQK